MNVTRKYQLLLINQIISFISSPLCRGKNKQNAYSVGWESAVGADLGGRVLNFNVKFDFVSLINESDKEGYFERLFYLNPNW